MLLGRPTPLAKGKKGKTGKPCKKPLPRLPGQQPGLNLKGIIKVIKGTLKDKTQISFSFILQCTVTINIKTLYPWHAADLCIFTVYGGEAGPVPLWC